MKKDKILIISGTHGNELSAVQLGLRLKKYYKKEAHIKVIPFLNESGLVDNSRDTVGEHTKDLNRSFRELNRTYNDTITLIEELVSDYDYVIDIHNSHRCANFCLIDAGKNEDFLTSLCQASNVEYATRFSTGGTIKDYVNSHGKFGLTYEFSGMTTLNNKVELEKAFYDVTSLVRTINNKDLVGDRADAPRQNMKQLHCLEDGFINFEKDINDIVKPGEVVFEVIDSNGEVIETVLNMYKNYNIKLIALGHSFQTRGSSVLHYIKKGI